MEKKTIYWIIGIILVSIIIKSPISFTIFSGMEIPYFGIKGFLPWWLIIGAILFYIFYWRKN